MSLNSYHIVAPPTFNLRITNTCMECGERRAFNFNIVCLLEIEITEVFFTAYVMFLTKYVICLKTKQGA